MFRRVLPLVFIALVACGSDNDDNKPARELALGTEHSCSLENGAVKCWGGNDYGELGDGTTRDRVQPTPVANLGSSIQIAAANRETCAILTDRTVSCWGGSDRFAATKVPGLTNVIQIAKGMNHTCALLQDRSVQCWGRGYLGDGSRGERTSSTPVRVDAYSDVVEIAAGNKTTCMRRADESVWCFGRILGPWTSNVDTRPTQIANVQGAVQLSVSANHACARLRTGAVACWGNNSEGQLGDDFDSTRSAVQLRSVDNVVDISTGDTSTFAVRADGTVRSFGWLPNYGEDAAPNDLEKVVRVSASKNHACAILNDGNFRCWGSNAKDQLGRYEW